MATQSSIIAEILHCLADAIAAGNDDALTELLRAAKGVSVQDLTQVKQPVRKKKQLPDENSETLHSRFSAFESRELLEKHLIETYETKAELTRLAKKLQIHTAKSDDAASIVNRIIDATLGYRLRQRAIRGE